jgi:hypothetical protein
MKILVTGGVDFIRMYFSNQKNLYAGDLRIAWKKELKNVKNIFL